ncbi:hypothetical protein ACFPK5_38085 [Streptomyces beijiangensis]|uniref:hypothetical protein n=1 Tax=Streptomyces beijiangensis TaxID=163361 RepID=UPI0031CFC7C9
MAERARRRTAARRRRELKQRAALAAAVLVGVLVFAWAFLGAAALSAGGALGYVLWSAHRRVRAGDNTWREQERRGASVAIVSTASS